LPGVDAFRELVREQTPINHSDSARNGLAAFFSLQFFVKRKWQTKLKKMRSRKFNLLIPFLGYWGVSQSRHFHAYFKHHSVLAQRVPFQILINKPLATKAPKFHFTEDLIKLKPRKD
jgi:hypothetical protein